MALPPRAFAAALVVFYEADDTACMVAAMHDGAEGFLMKKLTRPPHLGGAAPVARRHSYLRPRRWAMRRIIAPVRRRKADTDDRRARRAAPLVKGFRNKQIAQPLKIAEDTVKQHARADLQRARVSSSHAGDDRRPRGENPRRMS